ncbi:hypothetical protein QTA58_22900 [Neorhizobium sp. CSC1952]|uniref:hypothetical protein n=1 Tax=Neorhizobium sp. CSC1952 TaxID=2978974 RepID=UPI0025A5135C|nr:hypothetical protein [Rhizobium sp. CSC1952]WJR67002.1 hypothetical protein QTA58_22900 [Rhizobium sp. CSC1952]
MPVRYEAHELLICDRCGAILALGKYKALSRPGRESNNCMADLRTVPADEANKMLADYLSGRAALREEKGE